MWKECPVCSSSNTKPTARFLSPTPTLTSSSTPCAVSLMPAGYPEKQNDILWNQLLFPGCTASINVTGSQKGPLVIRHKETIFKSDWDLQVISQKTAGTGLK